MSSEILQSSSKWKTECVGNVFDIQQGKQVSKKNRIGDNQRPFLRTRNVFWGRLDTTELDEMNFTHSEEQKLKLNRGDLLLCEGGSVGRTAVWDREQDDIYYQNHLFRLRVKNNRIDPFFAMLWFWYAFEIGGVYFGRANSTTIANLSKSRLSELPILVPDISIQKKIVLIISTVMESKNQHGKIEGFSSELLSAVMMHLFSHGLHNETRKNTEIGYVPESWRKFSLGDVICLEYGKPLPKEDRDPTGSFPVFASNGEKTRSNKFHCQKPTIIVGRKGSAGKLTLTEEKCWPLDVTFYVTFDSEKFDLKFLYYLLKTINLPSLASGIKPGINRNHVYSEQVYLPSLGEQKEIANILEVIQTKIDNSVEKQDILQELFQSLLIELMTSQIDVDEIDFSTYNFESKVFEEVN